MIRKLVFLTVAVMLALTACATSSQPMPTVTKFAPTQTPFPIPTASPTIAPPTPTLTVEARIRPSPRGEMPLAYDSKRNQILLFGGATGDPNISMDNVNGETWIYDVAKNTWTEVVSPISPSPRDNVLLAYDSESDRIILFGGWNMNLFGWRDTWAFDMDTKTWEKKSMKTTSHFGGSMVYDNKVDRIIVFGGWDTKKQDASNDTWEYNYNTDTWKNLNPAIKPPGRQFPAMVYDSKADRIIMWGGWGYLAHPNDTDIWIYDYNTNTWEERQTENSPSSRGFHSMAYDTKSDRTILYGGLTGPAPLNVPDYKTNSSQTWAYDYNINTWKLIEPAINPGALSFVGFVYVPSIERTLLFGGKFTLTIHSDKIWLFDFPTNTWIELPPNH